MPDETVTGTNIVPQTPIEINPTVSLYESQIAELTARLDALTPKPVDTPAPAKKGTVDIATLEGDLSELFSDGVSIFLNHGDGSATLLGTIERLGGLLKGH